MLFGVQAVTDHKHLNAAEQPLSRRKRMSVIAIALIGRFFQFQASALHFDLHQGQAAVLQSHIVAIGVFTLQVT